jgi:gluconokinase
MGVAGCGKSTLGAVIAASLGCRFVEGDNFHSETSRLKMSGGAPLSDDDRLSWLHELGAQLARETRTVLSCSALKVSYRALLRAYAPTLRFVFLDIDEEDAHARVAAREAEHCFPAALVASQFEVLERPYDEPGVLWLDATLPLAQLQAHALRWISSSSPHAELQADRSPSR